MPVKIGGLPAHPLIVHAVVVLLPLAAVMLVLGVLWPAARHKFGFLTPLVALAGLVLVPVATHAGEWLKGQLPPSAEIEHHAHLGRMLLPWAAAVFVMSAAVWLVGRRRELSWRPSPQRQPEVTPTESPSSGATATLTRPVAVAAPQLTAPVWVTAVLTVLSIAVAVGMSILLYKVGESGAHAAWNGVGSGAH